jgi:hypothetical protein
MSFKLPDEVLRLLASQGQVIARVQALGMGLDGETVRNRLRYGDWQQLQTGVYAAFTGAPSARRKSGQLCCAQAPVPP